MDKAIQKKYSAKKSGPHIWFWKSLWAHARNQAALNAVFEGFSFENSLNIMSSFILDWATYNYLLNRHKTAWETQRKQQGFLREYLPWQYKAYLTKSSLSWRS